MPFSGGDEMEPSLPDHVVITPVFEDSEAAGQMFHALSAAIGSNVFVIAVDDGSVSQPLHQGSIGKAGLDGIVIRLKRNVGHQRAIAVGLGYAAEHFPEATTIVMDCDGEDLPEQIEDLLTGLSKPRVDVVVARRKKRLETTSFKIFYFFYRHLFRLLTGRKISFGNFMVLSPFAVKRLVAMSELWIHVAGCLLVSKLRIHHISLDRGPRYAGQSKMNFHGLVLHGFRAFMIFAEDVLVRVGVACASIAALSIMGISLSILLKSAGMASPGWFSMALGILVLVLIQTGTLILMTLMLTGIVRNGISVSINYLDFIDEVCPAERPDNV